MAKQNNLVANTVLQNYMMERFLERVSVSQYKDNFILKGGFLIAAMVGIDMRSTMDMDTTITGIPVDREQAIIKKSEERNSIVYVENYQKYLTDVLESEDVQKIWDNYKNKYLYAKDIMFFDIINCIEEVLK